VLEEMLDEVEGGECKTRGVVVVVEVVGGGLIGGR
jgi:hypothetical protein